MNRDEVITDRSAWKTDDPQWVKMRRQQWREIRKVLEYETLEPLHAQPFRYLKKKQHKRLKDFFLSGYVESKPLFGEGTELHPPPNNPLKGIEAQDLFYIWLHADSAHENWEALRRASATACGKYNNIKEIRSHSSWPRVQERFFYSINNYPTEGTLFGGVEFERRLYQLICPSDGIYAPNTDKLNSALSGCLERFFTRHKISGKRKIFFSSPSHIVQHGLEDFIRTNQIMFNDNFASAISKDKALMKKFSHESFVQHICNCHLALEFAENNPPIYSEVAGKLLAMIEQFDWPDDAQYIMESGREMYEYEKKRV